MIRYLVTGATGGLGRNAVRLLLERGVAVRACGRNPAAGRALQQEGAQFVALDLALCSDAELDALVASAISETGAESPRDMGKAIKHLMTAAGGRADGMRVSGKVMEAWTA
jgi:NAD(P)-dependent dehydrogenase (short-subunit alcohol dehydrogenase family)